MTAKQFQTLLKKKHRVVIGAQFGLLIILASMIGHQYRQLTARDSSSQSVHESMQLISETHAEEWAAHYQAMENALKMPDAYLVGIEEVDRVYGKVIDATNEAVDHKNRIIEELEKYGIAPPPEEPTPAT